MQFFVKNNTTMSNMNYDLNIVYARIIEVIEIDINLNVIYAESIEDNLIHKPPLEVKIDFDYAKREWRKNKFHLGNGHFEYRCCAIIASGGICKKRISTCKSSSHIKKRSLK